MRRFSSKLLQNLPRQYLGCYQQQRFKEDAAAVVETKQDKSSSLKYCMAVVEKYDYENYLCTLLLGREQRNAAFVLRAFNAEVARCGGSTTQQEIVKMRLKFWSESIDKCFEGNASYIMDQPVLKELKNVINSTSLSKFYLHRLVNARDNQICKKFITIQDMETYSESTFSTLMYLLVELFGVKDINVDHAASHLGKAQGITTLLRSVPFTQPGQLINIPQDILIANGVSQERILRLEPGDTGVENCVFEVASAAHQHLEKARSLIDKIPKEMRRLFITAVVIDRYLERLKSANFKYSSSSIT